MGWQPIKTAPAPSGEVLVWDGNYVYTAMLRKRSWAPTAPEEPGEWFASSGGDITFPDDGSCGEYDLVPEQLFPTHWMPKPAGPTP